MIANSYFSDPEKKFRVIYVPTSYGRNDERTWEMWSIEEYHDAIEKAFCDDNVEELQFLLTEILYGIDFFLSNEKFVR